MPHKQRFIVRPLFLQVRDELAASVANGTWKAGAPLPNEASIAHEMGVSQGTVRKALDLLEAEKIVVRRQGRGTFVVDHDTEEMAFRFSSICHGLEQRISGHISHSTGLFCEPSKEEQAGLGIGPSEKILRIKRVRHYHDHPFMYEEVAIVARHFPNLTIESCREPRLSSLAQKHGIQLSHAIERVAPALCPDFAMEPLNLEERLPILLLHRTVFKADGIAVEYRIAWCHLRDKHYMSITN